MPTSNKGYGPTPETLGLAAGLRTYQLATDKSQAEIGKIIGVTQQTVGSWMRTGRMQPRFISVIRELLLDAGIEPVWAEPEPPKGYIHIHELARAAMLLRLRDGPNVNGAEAKMFLDLGTDVTESGVAILGLLNRVVYGPPMGRNEVLIFRDAFDIPHKNTAQD